MGAVGRAWGHPKNAHKAEVETLFDRWATNTTTTGHPLVPPDPGERGNSDSGAATTTGQSCGSCRAFQRDPKHPGEGTCNRHAPVVEGRGLGLGLWPGVTEADFCCEWLPHPVAQTPLTAPPHGEAKD
jgi:hypothetical protein